MYDQPTSSTSRMGWTPAFSEDSQDEMDDNYVPKGKHVSAQPNRSHVFNRSPSSLNEFGVQNTQPYSQELNFGEDNDDEIEPAHLITQDFDGMLGGPEGIEETQLMSQQSVRKRDKRKLKNSATLARRAAKKESETPEEKSERLKTKAEEEAYRRSLETDQERSYIKRNKRLKLADSRARESDEQREERYESVSLRRDLRQKSETPEDRFKRLQTSAQHKSSGRAEENTDEKDERNRANAERMATRRSEESDDVAQKRRESDAKSTAAARRNETVSQKSARKAADRQRKDARPGALLGVAASGIEPDLHYFGRMDQDCKNCDARYFKAETTQKGDYTMCCSQGAIRFEKPKTLPSTLLKLYLTPADEEPGDDEDKKKLRKDAKNFREHIRQFNNSLAMASMKAEVSLPSGGPYTYRIHKQVYHLTGDLHPAPGEPRKFAQVFIIDTAQAAAELAGTDMNASCSEELFQTLIDILKIHHPHAQSFKMMHQIELEEKEKAELENRPERRVTMTFRIRSQDDQRRYQNPTADEVAVIYVGDDDEIPGERGLTVHQRSGRLQSLHIIDPNCDPMSYPLIFVYGTLGWHPKIPYAKQIGKRIHVTMREFYAYILHVRSYFHPLFRSGKLFQQFVVDVWARVEQNRLNYLRMNQAQLRVESMSGLQDYVIGEEKGPIGARILLPASHTGSPRDMVQQYQDAMSVVAKYGKPDYFITLTCNPKWSEIQECLANGQTATDRPEIVARVFQMKIDEFRDDIVKKEILGEVQAYIFVIEFQKRGLPHLHMLLIMKTGSKPRTASDVDKIISAEIPDKEKNPRLHQLVTSLMMHRPCGIHNPASPCMTKGACSKNFPKSYRDETSTDNDGFSLYRRRNDGRIHEHKMGRKTVKLTNQQVVPHNPWLLLKYNCHINVEVCGAISSVKYLYKYVYKGTTRASIVIKIDENGNERREIDEIKQYLDTRYVCAPEAVHHLFGFKMSHRSVSVVQLTVHLEDDRQVVFQAGKEKEAVARAETKNTTLTAWFEINQKSKSAVLPDGSFPPTLKDSRNYYYHEMPEHFRFVSGVWQPRKTKEFSLGRMYFISPKNRDKFALRQLLLYTRGSTSFKDLRTVNGVEWPSYVEAARAAGFLSDDLVYEKTLQEAAQFHSSSQMRGLFVTLLLFETIDNSEALWLKFLDELSEDFRHQGYSEAESHSLAYYDMSDRAEAMGEDLQKWIKCTYTRVHQFGQVTDVKQCEKLGKEMRDKLNPEQKKAVDEILSSDGGLYFIDGPGGSGKTFVYNTLANTLMGENKSILCMAWVGIAAALLPNGRTVASVCKLDINNGCKTSRINPRSPFAKWLSEVSLILWDEAPMSPKAALETVDTLFREITQIDLPFGGKTVVLGGDFRQVLPVMDRGGADEQIANCINRSALWKEFKIHRLSSNMRVQGEASEWKKELLEIGDGQVGAPVTGQMSIPEGLESTGDLAEKVFGDLLASGDVEKLAKVAILAPRNKEALELNNKVLDKMPGQVKIYKSLDEISDKDGKPVVTDAMHFTTEFLNQMTPSGMPPHEIRLKKGAIIMLLRNLDVRNSMCNGTRFVVVEMGDRVLQCKFVGGPRQGQMVLIPRIKLNYEKNLPFVMSRLQFPIRLSFAMTVNKSQGQTFERIGLHLEEPIFSHGQLYVALSRTTTKEGVIIHAPSGMVNNVVYREVLL